VPPLLRERKSRALERSNGGVAGELRKRASMTREKEAGQRGKQGGQKKRAFQAIMENEWLARNHGKRQQILLCMSMSMSSQEIIAFFSL